MINAVLERCAGIDIGKKFLMACLMAGAADQEPNVLEGTVVVIVAHAQQVKPARATRRIPTTARLAHLLRHAMIRPSFVPPHDSGIARTDPTAAGS